MRISRVCCLSLILGLLHQTCLAGEYGNWIARERAMRVQMGRKAKLGHFDITLPLGWIAEQPTAADSPLTYVSGRWVRAKTLPTVTFQTLPAPNTWPDTTPNWVHTKVAGFPCVRVSTTREDDVRHSLYGSTANSGWALHITIPGTDSEWPTYAQDLLDKLAYRGTESPAVPPKVSPADVRVARQQLATGDYASHRSIFAHSPFYPYALKTRYALSRNVDPITENYVTIVNSGYDALALRIHLIRNASRSIKIQTFILASDETARYILYELLQAARRGVKVQIIADHFASTHNLTLIASLAVAHPNFEMKHYRPAAGRIRPSSLQESIDYIIPNATNQRMHNKLFIVDDVLFITGGRNIENCYYDQEPGRNFKDRDVLVIGPLVRYAAGSFQEYWTFEKSVASKDLKDVRKAIARKRIKPLNTRADFRIEGMFDDVDRAAADPEYVTRGFINTAHKARRALFLADKPGKHSRLFSLWGRGRITRQLEKMIQSAEHSIVIQSPYLVLDRTTRKLFKKLKKKNPDMRLEISSNSFAATDSAIAYSANFRLRSSYIEGAGLTIYEFKPYPAHLLSVMPMYPRLEKRFLELKKDVKNARRPFLCIHAKAFVVDDLVAYIGSYNLDPRSATLNTEVGLLVEDPVIAAALKKNIVLDMHPENSWVIAKRQIPLGLDAVNRIFEGALSLTPIDIWPIRNTTSFELKKGRPPVKPDHPEFYKHYKDIGYFPGADSSLSSKERLVRLYKVFGRIAQPMM